jgi:hypothetical protein
MPNQVPVKAMVFRIPETLKTDFRVALMKRRIDVQHTMEAFVEYFVSYDNGELKQHKNLDVMDAIMKRAVTLTLGG